jgi:hypothetical protein
MEHQGWDRQRNRQFFSGMLRGVSDPREGARRSSLSSPKPADQPRHLSVRGSLSFIQASFLTGVSLITHVSGRITLCKLRCSRVVTDGVRCVTGGGRSRSPP